MAFNAKTNSVSLGSATIIDPTHPPIIKNGDIKANQGTLARGLVVALDADSKYVPYDPAGLAPLNAPKGILTEEVDTTKETAGPVLKHGTAVWANVLVGAGAPAAADIAKLNAIGIY